MASITFRTSRDSDNVTVVRAEIGLKWATFALDGALIETGADYLCQPSADQVAQMIAEAPANVARLAAAHRAERAAAAKSAFRPAARRNFDNRYDMGGRNLSRAMDYEDSAL